MRPVVLQCQEMGEEARRQISKIQGGAARAQTGNQESRCHGSQGKTSVSGGWMSNVAERPQRTSSGI